MTIKTEGLVSPNETDIVHTDFRDAQARERARHNACVQGKHSPLQRYMGSSEGFDHWQCQWCNQLVKTEQLVDTI